VAATRGHLFHIYLCSVEIMSKKKFTLIMLLMYALGFISSEYRQEIIYAVCSKAQGYKEALN